MIPHGELKNLTLVALLLFVHMIFTPGFAEPNFIFCQGNENYTNNSLYEKNLNSLLDLISLKTSKEGFYKTKYGSGGNEVYGQALCRGDITRKDCHDCVANVSTEVMKQCPGSREAFLWYEKCQVQYSFSPDFSDTYAGKFPKSNENENIVLDHREQFKNKLVRLMDDLAKKTYGSKSMFATGKTKFEKTTIYALEQCSRNITQDLCGTCLNKALAELYANWGDHQGGTVFSRSCNVRFSVNTFYREPTNGTVKRMWMVVAVTCGLTLAIVVLVGCYVFLRCQRMEQNTNDDSSENIFLHSMGASARIVITEESNIVSGQVMRSDQYYHRATL